MSVSKAPRSKWPSLERYGPINSKPPMPCWPMKRECWRRQRHSEKHRRNFNNSGARREHVNSCSSSATDGPMDRAPLRFFKSSAERYRGDWRRAPEADGPRRRRADAKPRPERRSRRYRRFLRPSCDRRVPSHFGGQFRTPGAGAKAKYVLGLSATVTRKDGHHPIIAMQCGPIRFRVDARSEAARRPFNHFVRIRETKFRLEPEMSSTTAPIPGNISRAERKRRTE